ncbi:MAG: STAS domain-containing protein [Pirellulales bacterium]
MQTSATGDAAQEMATCEVRDGVLVATVKLSEIRDSHTAYAFRDFIAAQLDRQPAVHIVFDCCAVKFIGSVGFLAFLGVRRKQPTGRIVLTNLAPTIREMFEICRLLARDDSDTIAPFESCETPETAIRKLALH